MFLRTKISEIPVSNFGSGTARLSLSDHLRLIVRIWFRIRSEGVHRVERAGNLSKCWDYLVDHCKELEVTLMLSIRFYI